MGFSTSGAAAIIFVGLFVAAGLVFPALEGAHERRVDALEERTDRALEVTNTDVELLEASHDDGELTIELENVGSTALSAPATDLLVDGELVDAETAVREDDGTEPEADRERWLPGETLVLTADTDDFEDDPERVKVVVENGVAVTGDLTEGEDGG